VISQGRALAVAAAWIAVPLGGAALLVAAEAAGSDNPWDPLAAGLALGGAVVLTPAGLLVAAIVIARHGDRATTATTATATTTAAALGARAGLTGLVLPALLVAAFVLTHQ
jgi:hypothetical protein